MPAFSSRSPFPGKRWHCAPCGLIFTLDHDAATMIVGIFGTTISPYLFFWQASEEVEDMRRNKDAKALVRDGREANRELRRIGWDTWSGMLYSDVTAFLIILATAVT